MQKQTRVPTNPASYGVDRLAWVTNDAETAERLRIIDAQYNADRADAAGLCLADKIVALRQAGERKEAAYRQVLDENAAG